MQNRILGSLINTFLYNTQDTYNITIYGFVTGSPLDGRFILTAFIKKLNKTSSMSL